TREVAALPAVGAEEDDRAASEHASRPAAIELVQRVADARAAGPIRDRMRHAGDGGVGAAPPDLPRHAREPRPEGEGLDAAPAARERVREVEEESRVRLHRARDVEEEDERPALPARRPAQ